MCKNRDYSFLKKDSVIGVTGLITKEGPNRPFVIKCTLVQALRLCTSRTANRESRGITLLFLDHGTGRGDGPASRPGCSLPPEKTQYLLYRRLGGSQGRPGQVRKISHQPGFDPQTFQPVASCYTDWATGPTVLLQADKIFDCLRNYVTSLILTKELCCLHLDLQNLQFVCLITTVLRYKVQSS